MKFNVMINFGLNLISLVGLIDILLACLYIILARTRWKSTFREVLSDKLYNVQSLVMPLFVIIIGFILVLVGWRLDPILQSAFFLTQLLFLYITAKDIVIFNLISKDLKSNA